ncbi:1 TM domain-containing transmembrane protein [Acrasis kona]|uniref:1 TM domain-containing transmembrane protein n=1 Tax=Acrasis kona TaxID=1008807 RepID=A0AAW2ZF10_9EUKA
MKLAGIVLETVWSHIGRPNRTKAMEIVNHQLSHGMGYTSFYIPYFASCNEHFGRSHMYWVVRPRTNHQNTSDAELGCEFIPNKPNILLDQTDGDNKNKHSSDLFYYNIYRTGCFPFIKYYCVRTNKQQTEIGWEEQMYRIIKFINLGIPTLAYGMISLIMVKSVKYIQTSQGQVPILFLYKYDDGSDS